MRRPTHTTRHPRELKNHDCRFAGRDLNVSNPPISKANQPETIITHRHPSLRLATARGGSLLRRLSVGVRSQWSWGRLRRLSGVWQFGRSPAELRPPLFALYKRRPGPLMLGLDTSRFASELRTSRLIQPFFHRLQLSFKLLVLDCKPAIRILKHGLKTLYPLVPCQQLPFGDTGFFLQTRVLIDKLHERNHIMELVRTRPTRCCHFTRKH